MGLLALLPVIFVSDPKVLAAVEQRGGAFAQRVDAAAWRPIAEVLAREVDEARRGDPESGESVAGHSHRVFHVAWLGLAGARLELIGVANRIDRQPMSPGCGDTRLLYRLAYQASRLPMTVSLVYSVPDDGEGCKAAARRWLGPAVVSADWLLVPGEGPLALTTPDRLRSVEVNLQIMRWPSAARPDLGGHAEYLLRAFRPGPGGRFVPQPLDNTPDVARLKKDKRLRAELLAWLLDDKNRAAVDAGTALLPEKFLAIRAISVTPHGLGRRANRLFGQVFSPAAVAGLTGGRTMKSPEAVLRRLDDASCVGCHEARSLAGFHFLGVDDAGSLAANSLAVAMSPHLHDEILRRAALVEALARGEVPDFVRPVSDRGDGGYGAHCGTGDPGFAEWTCKPGLRCLAADGVVGACFPAEAGLGDPCETGRFEASVDAHRDRMSRVTVGKCPPGAVCNRSKVGFPGGMCTGGCDHLGDGAACGAIAVLDGFNNCLARGEPFAACLANNVTPAGLRACDADRPCRDDYICARHGSALDEGACIPPYFLFQLRVDGHP